jgi:DNA repair protein RadC
MNNGVEETDDLPRERLGRLGVRSLSDGELLALVLGHGTPRRSAREIATQLLRDAGGVHGLARASVDRMALVPGVGKAQASRVMAAVELGRRTLTTSPRPREPLGSPRAMAEYLLPRYGAHSAERFGVLLLDSRHRYIRVVIVSEGSMDAAVALPRDVFREATIAGAAAVVLFHNHPSGDPTPSRADIQLTQRLMDAGEIIGIDVLDHLVLADSRYCSMLRSEDP